MSAAHTPGPWFIWKERAMQDEGMEPDEINAELLECSYFEVMAGKPIGGVSRGMIKGCNEVVELDSEDFGDDEEVGRQTALANARLIAAAPCMLAALIVAREFISTDRNSLADCCVDPEGGMSPDDAAAVADYDAALLQIDAAIKKATGGAA
jgi:hypothetical protein